MARILIKQPDGDFAMYSTISDSFVIWNASEKELKEWYVEDAARKAEEEIERRIDDCVAGRHFGFRRSWKAMVKDHNQNCDQKI